MPRQPTHRQQHGTSRHPKHGGATKRGRRGSAKHGKP